MSNNSITNTNDQYHYLTWDCIKAALESLAMLLPRDTQLYPIPRGGHVVASLLTYHRPDIQIVTGKLSGAYWFDDIVDTGTTMVDAHKFHGRTISLYKRDFKYTSPQRSWEPLFCGKTFYCDKWIVFPWDINVETERQQYLKRIGEQNGKE